MGRSLLRFVALEEAVVLLSCVLTGRKQDVESALAAEEGAEVLSWKVAREGLTVREG